MVRAHQVIKPAVWMVFSLCLGAVVAVEDPCETMQDILVSETSTRIQVACGVPEAPIAEMKRLAVQVAAADAASELLVRINGVDGPEESPCPLTEVLYATSECPTEFENDGSFAGLTWLPTGSSDQLLLRFGSESSRLTAFGPEHKFALGAGLAAERNKSLNLDISITAYPQQCSPANVLRIDQASAMAFTQQCGASPQFRLDFRSSVETSEQGPRRVHVRTSKSQATEPKLVLAQTQCPAYDSAGSAELVLDASRSRQSSRYFYYTYDLPASDQFTYPFNGPQLSDYYLRVYYADPSTPCPPSDVSGAIQVATAEFPSEEDAETEEPSVTPTTSPWLAVGVAGACVVVALVVLRSRGRDDPQTQQHEQHQGGASDDMFPGFAAGSVPGREGNPEYAQGSSNSGTAVADAHVGAGAAQYAPPQPVGPPATAAPQHPPPQSDAVGRTGAAAADGGDEPIPPASPLLGEREDVSDPNLYGDVRQYL